MCQENLGSFAKVEVELEAALNKAVNEEFNITKTRKACAADAQLLTIKSVRNSFRVTQRICMS